MYKTIIVDDENWIITGLELLIDWESFGFTIINKFTSSIEALDSIQNSDTKPDLVITDVKIAGMDGLELINHIKDISPATMFIMISGFSEFEYAHTALKLGVTDYLLKPIECDDLKTALSRVASSIQNALSEQNVINFEDELKFFKKMQWTKNNEMLYKHMGFYKKLPCYILVITELPISGFSNLLRYLDTKITFSLFKAEKTKTLIVVNFNNNQREYLMEYLHTSLCDYKTGISQIKCNIIEIFSAFEEASISFHSYFLNSDVKFHIYLYDEVKIIPQIIDIFTNYFAENNFTKLQSLIDTLPKCFALNKLSIKDLHVIYNNFANSINKINGKNTENNMPLISDYSNIEENFENINQIICLMHDEIERLSVLNNTKFISYSSAKYIIPRIKDYIDHYFKDDITLSVLSDKFTIDERYLSRLFKEGIGDNFIAYLNKVRISHAQLLLVNTEMTIQDISYLCGYNDYFYFTKVYKKITGISPSKYRNEKKHLKK